MNLRLTVTTIPLPALQFSPRQHYNHRRHRSKDRGNRSKKRYQIRRRSRLFLPLTLPRERQSMKHEPSAIRNSIVVGLIQLDGRAANIYASVAAPGSRRFTQRRWQAPMRTEQVGVESVETLRSQLGCELARFQQRLVAAT